MPEKFEKKKVRVQFSFPTLIQETQGSEAILQSKSAENAENAGGKYGKLAFKSEKST